MNAILTEVFALYLKTKNFHWHMSGPRLRAYHMLFAEQVVQLFSMTNPIGERSRKVGESTLGSIGHIGHIQRIRDNNTEYVEPDDVLDELCEAVLIVDVMGAFHVTRLSAPNNAEPFYVHFEGYFKERRESRVVFSHDHAKPAVGGRCG